jgi:hypothetical protein
MQGFAVGCGVKLNDVHPLRLMQLANEGELAEQIASATVEYDESSAGQVAGQVDGSRRRMTRCGGAIDECGALATDAAGRDAHPLGDAAHDRLQPGQGGASGRLLQGMAAWAVQDMNAFGGQTPAGGSHQERGPGDSGQGCDVAETGHGQQVNARELDAGVIAPEGLDHLLKPAGSAVIRRGEDVVRQRVRDPTFSQLEVRG